jgi:Ala-tRNA(Pro) deacylase
MKSEDYLGRQKVPFQVIEHPTAYEAQRIAEAVHVSGYNVAKTVLLRGEGGAYAIAMLPAPYIVDLAKTAKALGWNKAELASEDEIASRFSDLERGVVPPFGAAHGIRTLVEQSLTEDDEIIFEGSTHEKAIRMSFEDFRKVEKPAIARFAAVP